MCYYTTDEVAEIFGVSRSTIVRWCKIGKMLNTNYGRGKGRGIEISEDSLEEFAKTSYKYGRIYLMHKYISEDKDSRVGYLLVVKKLFEG